MNLTPAKTVAIPWVLLALVTLAGGLYLYFAKPKIVYQPVPGPVKYVHEPKVVEKVKKVYVNVANARIEYFPKKELAERLKMPEIERMTDNVVAVGEVPPHSGKTTVLGTLNLEEDGIHRGGLIFRQEPTKFWELKKSYGVEGWYFPMGLNQIEMDVVANPLRTGPVDWVLKGGITVERDSGTIRAMGGIGVHYSF